MVGWWCVKVPEIYKCNAQMRFAPAGHGKGAVDAHFGVIFRNREQIAARRTFSGESAPPL